jgi:hypothetical protein
MSTATPSKTTEIAADRLLIAGIQKHLANTSVLVNGTSYSGAALEARVRARLDAVNATIAARAAWLAAVKAEEQALAESKTFYNSFKKGLFTMFEAVDDLADFGLAPHKKPVMTPDEKVAATAKAMATRAARHTMGKRQRLAITGENPGPARPASPGVPAVVASPVAAATPPVGPLQPPGSAAGPPVADS